MSGKVDYLRGLKENVIMGRLIPAGTGLSLYRKLGIKTEHDGDGAELPAEEVRDDEREMEKSLDIIVAS